MRRRDFLGGVGLAALAWPVTALGQQSDRKRLVAVELALDESDRDGKRSVDAFQQELRDLGWTSENLRIEYRWGATTPESARVHAAELIKLNPDVIVSHATIVTRAVSQGTKKIPIVFTNVSDPIGEKFVESFAKPGGNITGFTNIESTMGAKYLQLLKDVAPSVTRARCFSIRNRHLEADHISLTRSRRPLRNFRYRQSRRRFRMRPESKRRFLRSQAAAGPVLSLSANPSRMRIAPASLN